MSYTLKYTGSEIDDILDRAVEGGAIDEELALKAPLESPALTGTPTAPTPAESDNSTKVATTAYADRAAAGAAAAAYPVDTASGAIASFADGADSIPMKSFVCSIDPIQNLNGQSAPYPAGAGKNKLNPTGESGTTSGITTTKNSDGTYTVTGGNTYTSAVAILAGEWQAKAGVTYTLNGCPSGGSNDSYRLDIRTSPTTPYQGTPVDTGSGVNITPSSDATLYVYMRFAIGYNISGSLSFKPMIRLATEADATFAPYSNVCPISGHSGVNAVVAGFNLLPTLEGRENNGVTFTRNSDGSVSLSGTASATAYYLPSSADKKLIKAGTYYISGGVSSNISVYVGGTYVDGTTAPTNRSEGSEISITLTQDANLYLQIRVLSGTDTTGVKVYPMISPQSGQPYTPYVGTTYPVTFVDGDNPLTVYKGTIDLVSGVLTVTHWGVDMGDLEWSQGSVAYYATLTDTPKVPANNNTPPDAICSRYPTATYNQVNGGTLGINIRTSNGWVYVYDNTVADLDAFNAAVNGETLVYALETPLVYNLTPTEVLTLLGQNNCYNDCSNTAVEYRADIALYVQKFLGGNMSTLSMSAPTPSLSLGRTGVLLEPDALEPVITEDAEPDLAEEEPEAEEE